MLLLSNHMYPGGSGQMDALINVMEALVESFGRRGFNLFTFLIGKTKPSSSHDLSQIREFK